MKLCFSTLGCHDLSLDEILMLAQRHGIHALEVRGVHGEMSNSKIKDFQSDCLDVTLKKFEEAQVKPWILGTSCKFHDKNKRQEMIQKGKEEIQLASMCHFQGIRVFGDKIAGDETECVDEVGKAMDELCAFASKLNIKVFLEVHGDFNTIDRLNRVIEHITHQESFGLIWDIYHTHKSYGTSWRDFYEAMKQWICHVHIKDCIQEKLVLPGAGELGIVEIMNALCEAEYDGYFSLEWERKWFPELEPLDTALQYFERLIHKENKRGS